MMRKGANRSVGLVADLGFSGPRRIDLAVETDVARITINSNVVHFRPHFYPSFRKNASCVGTASQL
jgi:hypothetical protein